MIYCFDDFECDETRHELRQAGQVVAIEPKVFEVLRYFLEHPDRVVSKDELLDHCWSDTFVTESALTRCLTKLRKIVHNDPTAPPVIKTVPRQGYRFVAALITHASEPVVDTGHTAAAPDTASSPAPLSVGQSASPETLAAPSTNPNQPEPVASAEQPSPVAERRQLTVLFCDVVGSTALADQLDPEDLHEVLQAYHAACTEMIERFDGYVAQYLGDGLLVYFGYPQAHEDAARRAVHTGLGIVRAIADLNRRPERLHGVQVAVRIGIHTGLVMIGDVGTKNRVEQLAVGATPNIASRLQGLAAADTVVVSNETLQLVQGYFTYETMGTHTLTGVATPIAVYRILEESGAQSRLEAVTPRSLTPFIGRETELSLLQERWEQVQQGMGHVVVLNGEAGIGKSRLVRSLREGLEDVAHTRLECRCDPYHQHTVLYPVIDLLHRSLQADGDNTDTTQRLERLVQHCHLEREESVALLAPLLALTLPADRYASLQLSPQQQRQRTLETLLAMVLALAEHQPMLLIFEDVHWVDPSTLEWLGLLLDQGPTAPILTLMTCRPTFQSPWSGRAHVTSLTLNRLPRQQVEQMVQAIVGAEAVPTELVEQVVTTTDGVPLFVEEVSKLVVASEAHSIDGAHGAGAGVRQTVTIPTTLQDSLMARLDAVGAAKQTAQLGATIGRDFSHPLLQSVSSLDATTLQRHLGTLVAADLLHQRGVGPTTTYVFKHALIQEAAYTSLLRRTRQTYHQRIAQSLEAHFPDIVVSQPELVAHHYVQSEAWEPAFFSLYQAGEKARQAYANSEAISFYTQAIDASQHIMPALDADKLLGVYEGRGLVWMLLTKLDDAIADFQMMLQLARQMGDQQKEGESLCHLSFAHWGKFSEDQVPFAEQYAQEALQLSQQTGDHHIRAKSLTSLGIVHQWRGNLQEGDRRLEESLRISRQEQLQDSIAVNLMWLSAHAHWQGDFPRAIQLGQEGLTASRAIQDGLNELFGLAFLCLACWSAGDFAMAFEVLHEGRLKAHERENRFIFGRLTNTLGWFHSECGDLEQALAYDQESMELGRIHSIANVEISALVNIGYDHLALGQLDQARSYFEPTLERVQREAFGAHRWRWKMRLLMGLGEICYTTGDYEQALHYVDAGLQEAQATSSQKYVAKGWAMRGSILIKLGDTEAAGLELQRACILADQLLSPTLAYPLAYKLGQWYEAVGQEREAAVQYRKAQAVIENLATGLEDQVLRTTFLQSVPVRAIEACVARLDG
jgi:predicted ATPase/class 3 adenylate cyclase